VLAGAQGALARDDRARSIIRRDLVGVVQCLSSETLTRGGYLSTPTLIVNNQYDFNQTARLGININQTTGRVADSSQAAFVRRFAARMRAQLALADSQHAIYANYDVFHVTSHNDRSQSVTIGGTLQRDAIAEWHRDPCAPSRRIEAEIAGQPSF